MKNKSVGKKRVCKEVYSQVKTLLYDEKNGKVNANIIMGLLFDDSNETIRQSVLKYKSYRYGCSSEKQEKACYRVLFGRNYGKDEFDNLKMFINSPEFYYHEILKGISEKKREPMTWVNATKSVIENKEPVDLSGLTAF
jgi:hypothetical protein